MVQIDEFTARYADLLRGSYDCVDRIVLNGYYPLGHNAGGFRTWWRRWHDDGDQTLDNAHLMRLAGRFARRVKAWGSANAVPVVFCKAGVDTGNASTASQRTTWLSIRLVSASSWSWSPRPRPRCGR
jgi:hypothetical protein